MLLVHTNESDHEQILETNINKDLEEVFFLMSSNPTLDVDLIDVDQKALHYLQHRISRNPDDLRSHVQRIQLNIRLRDSEGVYGAILDLFIALSDKGIAIRRRMLSIARPQLLMNHRVFLSNALQFGLSSNDVMPETTCSALSLAYSGTKSIVANEEERQAGANDPLNLAQDCIEDGRIDDARDLLECAVIAQPWREEVHTELLNIYKATRDRVRTEKMYRKLADTSIPDHALWRETIRYVRQSTEKV